MKEDFSAEFKEISRPVQCRAKGSIIFWGSPMAFSDWILRVAEAESGFEHVVRVDSLADPQPAGGTQRYVFFDDNVAEVILGTAGVGPRVGDGVAWVHAYRDELLARRMLSRRRDGTALGNVGLLPMSLPIDTWTPMFRLVLSGDFVVPGRLLEIERDEPPCASRMVARNGTLTPREKEVLRLVARGMRNKTIAHELGLSEHTIKLHLHHVITKIGVRNRTQATQWYLTRANGGGQ